MPPFSALVTLTLMLALAGCEEKETAVTAPPNAPVPMSDDQLRADGAKPAEKPIATPAAIAEVHPRALHRHKKKKHPHMQIVRVQGNSLDLRAFAAAGRR